MKAKSKVLIALLMLATFVGSIFYAYYLGQRSQKPYIEGMAAQVENWKMIYRAESAKQSIVMAFRNNISLADFEKRFCADEPVSGVGVSGILRELSDPDGKYTHISVSYTHLTLPTKA